MRNAPTLELTSIGSLCATLRMPPPTIRRVANQLGIQPAARIDGVDMFSPAQAEQLADALRDRTPLPDPNPARSNRKDHQ